MIDILNIVKASFFTPLREDSNGETPWGLTLLLWGPPGVGKSQRVKSTCRDWSLECKVLSPGTDGEGAFGVTPVPDGDVMCYPPPYWAQSLQGAGVVFLDEVNQAPPTLQPAIMGIALDGRIGDHHLGNKVRRIAAANPTDIAAGGWDLAPPVANRFGHFDWDPPSAEDWCDWLLGSNAESNKQRDPAKEEARVLKAWAEPWAMSAGVVSGFVKARPGLLFTMPQAGSKDIARAWASPRTWEMAARAYASSSVHNLTSAEREVFVAGFVGEAAASELMSYIDKMDLPSPKDVLDGKVKFVHDPHRLDRTAAVLSSCAAYVAPKTCDKRKERAARLWELLGQKALLEDAMDVGFSAAKHLVLAKLIAIKEAEPVLRKMLPILKAAGVKFDPAKAAKASSGYEG